MTETAEMNTESDFSEGMCILFLSSNLDISWPCIHAKPSFQAKQKIKYKGLAETYVYR